MAFTPGPWILGEQADYEDCRIGIWKDDDLVALAAWADGFGPGECGEANACLIAAAPTLLAACQAIKKAAARDGLGRQEGPTSDALRLVDSAIAEALGQ